MQRIREFLISNSQLAIRNPAEPASIRPGVSMHHGAASRTLHSMPILKVIKAVVHRNTTALNKLACAYGVAPKAHPEPDIKGEMLV